MRIHRSHPEKYFTLISNETLRDERLSYTARGVLAELLSRPDGGARVQGRSRQGEGRRAMRAAFAELEAAGYLHRRRFHGERGQFVTELHLFDRPVTAIPDDDAPPPDRDTASGTPVPTGETARQPRSDRDTASGTPVHADRRTATGTPEPPAETGCLPGSDRHTANGRPVSGTSNRRQTTKNKKVSPDAPSASPGTLTRATSTGEIDHEQTTNGTRPAAARAGNDDAALVQLAQDEVERATGIRLNAEWGAKTVRLLLGNANGSVPNPAAYIRDSIRRERDPKTRFCPISRPGYNTPWQKRGAA
jgi:hypothetical protein